MRIQFVKLVMILISAAFSFGCSDSKRSDEGGIT